MSSFTIELPADFDDYGWEVEAKGWFSEAQIVSENKRYRINFYDPARLNQQVKDEFERGQVFFEPNLVIVPSITRANLEEAVEELVQSGLIRFLRPE